ncbi:hypothetical protein SQW19_05530 [Stenotrophomonas acidaminiphila]|uniref:hypothetical protein n=1 Tax=Stenotrophomonas acidaminiphila TaxID=128780 RepID=UPI002ABDC195|nr:hypothetical protein [Stenotrophomonas acidaminiphila]WPU57051.1 hypothetical protein SQW19_05530 [Stenotrophomonas acidaminiphila]
MFNSPGWASFIDEKMAEGVGAAVSMPRLGAYCEPGTPLAAGQAATFVAPVARHGRNIVLSEALYPVLHMIEVVLRNRIHDEFSTHFNDPAWYEQGWVTPRHVDMVNEAKADLLRKRKQPDPKRVVAELSFGFWCGMFHADYERGSGPWPSLLKKVLPRVPKSWATRSKVRDRLEDARLIRNRVFHHEPILQFSDLYSKHRSFVELLGWLSPDARKHIESLCRFNAVFNDKLILTPQTDPEQPGVGEGLQHDKTDAD